ncbi:MAG: surface lipoprotein assembly modifier [Pseudomonadota bacterium]
MQRYTGDELLWLAETLIVDNDFESAKPILDALSESATRSVDQTQVTFLQAVIHAAEGELIEARDLFRKILADNPELSRVRLELAQTLYALEDDEAARHHFNAVLADDPSMAVRRNIERFLQSMQKRKALQVRAALSLVPDSNVNNATTDDTVQLFGFLPADLSDDARRRSGLGMRSSLNVVWLPKIAENWRAELSGGGAFTDYENTTFDDVLTHADIGLRRIQSHGYTSVAGAFGHRWFGGASFYQSYGGRLFKTRRLSSRLSASGYISASYFDYKRDDGRDGPVLSSSINLLRALSSTSYAGARLSLTREFAKEEAFRSTDYSLQLSGIREFGGGLTVELTPSIGRRPFEGVNPLFAKRRKDIRAGVSIAATKRDWSYRGWAPVFSYGYTRNFSNINIYDFSRHRGELKFTRTF